MAYSEKLLEHFKHPKNVGTLDKSQKNVGTGLVGAPECGVKIHCSVLAEDAIKGAIEDYKSKNQ